MRGGERRCRRPRAAGGGPVDGLAAPRVRLAGTADGVRATGLAAPVDVGYDILACGQKSGGWRRGRGRRRPGWRRPGCGMPAVVAAVIEVHEILRLGNGGKVAVGKAGFGRLPGRAAVGKAGLAAAQSGGAGGGLAALYRIFCIGILLVWWGGECQGGWPPPKQVGAGGGFTDFYIGILLALRGGVRFRIIRLLPVLPRL